MAWAAVAMGGALGALARYALVLCLPTSQGRFPIATFTANICGCFIMGIIYVLVVERMLVPLHWKPFIATGFLGAFTTFSTFSVETLLLWQHQHFLLALLYVGASVTGCLLSVWLGYFCSHWYFFQ